METPEQIRDRLLIRFPGAEITVVPNPGPAAQHSILVPPARAREVALFLRDDPDLKLDYCSNMTGVDWPTQLEAVYHLYSMQKRHGPVILRMKTADRGQNVTLPSLTPVWRSCEFQEREAYDLYGIVFEGHPDLRRILMWDELTDHPMRKDYSPPDDFEWEPTPHADVLAKVQARTAPPPTQAPAP